MHTTTPPPLPTATDDILRVEHTRLRRRLLTSNFQQDLHLRLKANLGDVRQSAWGMPDQTANPFLSMMQQQSVLYNAEPSISSADPTGEEMAQLVANSGCWALMQRVQRDTLGLREMLVRVDVVDGAPTYRPVYPDLVEAWVHPRTPWKPNKLKEAVLDQSGNWVWHCFDLSDPGYPTYTVETPEGKDVTEEVLGGRFEGEGYTYRREDGTPILPYAIYHASWTGYLWDPYTLREVVEGSLNLCVLLTYYGHVVRNAAWAQRYGVNVAPMGLESTDTPVRREVVSDPATLLILQANGDGQPMVGQWSTPVDPESLLSSILTYERRLLSVGGIQPSDVTRAEADIRSGYSLVIDREKVRELQRLFEPQFRRGDRELLSITACLLNRGLGTNYPEAPENWGIVYRGLPEDPRTEGAKVEQLTAQVQAGLLSKVDAFHRLHPTISREQAAAALESIATENRRY